MSTLLGVFNNNFWSVFPAFTDVDIGNNNIKNVNKMAITEVDSARVGNPNGALSVTSNVDMGTNSLKVPSIGNDTNAVSVTSPVNTGTNNITTNVLIGDVNVISNTIQAGHTIAGDNVIAASNLATLPSGSVKADNIKPATANGTIAVAADLNMGTNNVVVNGVKVSSNTNKLTINNGTSTGTVYDTQFNPIPTPLTIPLGTIMMYGASTAPANDWLICDGSAISQTTYAGLYSVLGTTYGTSTNNTKFILPDLRYKFAQGGVVASGGTSVNTGGTSSNTMDVSQLPQHQHTYKDLHKWYEATWLANGDGGVTKAEIDATRQTAGEMLNDAGESPTYKYFTCFGNKVLTTGKYLTIELNNYYIGTKNIPTTVPTLIQTPHNLIAGDLVYVNASYLEQIDGSVSQHTLPSYGCSGMAFVKPWSSYDANTGAWQHTLYIKDKYTLVYMCGAWLDINMRVAPPYTVDSTTQQVTRGSYTNFPLPTFTIDGRPITHANPLWTFTPDMSGNMIYVADRKGEMLPRPFTTLPPFTSVNYIIKASLVGIEKGQYQDYPFNPTRKLVAYKYKLPPAIGTNGVDGAPPPIPSEGKGDNLATVANLLGIDKEVIAEEDGIYAIDAEWNPFSTSLYYNASLDKHEFTYNETKYFVDEIRYSDLDVVTYRLPDSRDPTGEKWIIGWNEILNDGGQPPDIFPTYSYEPQLRTNPRPPKPN